jgi:hypothetical protein
MQKDVEQLRRDEPQQPQHDTFRIFFKPLLRTGEKFNLLLWTCTLPPILDLLS